MRTLVRYIVDKFSSSDKPLCIFGILPTGYGKTSIVIENPHIIDRHGRFIHVLPLRAIVEKHSKKATQKLGSENVGYQAHVHLDDVYKTPFLSRRYVITTFDSFFLNFYGIPVAEILKPRWHSDLAILMSSSANLILDEVHMILNPDAAEEEDKEAFSKVLAITLDAITRALRLGHHVLVLSATMPPTLISTMVHYVLTELQKINSKADVEVVVYGDKGHRYVDNLGKELQGKNVELYVDRDKDFDELFQGINYEIQIDKDIKCVDDLANKVLDLSKKFDRVAVFVNTVATAYKVWSKIKERDPGVDVLILHSRLTPESRAKVMEVLESRSRYIVVATQSIEAGVDISFQAAVSVICSPFSAIQRVGRVCRYSKIRGENECIFVFTASLLDGVGTVYNKQEVDIFLDFLSKNHDKLRHGYSWRVPKVEELNVLDLVMIVDNFAKNNMQNLELSVGDIRTKLENMMYSKDPKSILKGYDEFFQGSFVRSTPILNLVFIDDNEIQIGGCVEVDTEYIEAIKRRWSIAVDLSTMALSRRRRDLVVDKSSDTIAVLGIAMVRCRDKRKVFVCAESVELEYLSRSPVTQLFNTRRSMKRLLKQRIGIDCGGYLEHDYDIYEVDVLGVAARKERLTVVDGMAMYV